MLNLTETHAAIECLRRLSDVFRQRRQQLASSVGLTEQQWSVLEEISTEHFMPSMFARQRESTAAAVSKILRQLIDKGLIVVSLSAEDGRQRHYELTEAGRRDLVRLRAERERAIEGVWRQLEPEAVREFTRFGNLLTARLEAYAEHESGAGHAARSAQRTWEGAPAQLSSAADGPAPDPSEDSPESKRGWGPARSAKRTWGGAPAEFTSAGEGSASDPSEEGPGNGTNAIRQGL
jgi:DNA-binding MarR family transcriptional regulator